VGNQEEVASGFPGLIWWDLYGAGRLMWGPSVRSVLIPPGTTWTCELSSVRPTVSRVLADRVYETAGKYGKSYVIDLQRRRWDRIDDADECRKMMDARGHTLSAR
jgi:hypothetical protein